VYLELVMTNVVGHSGNADGDEGLARQGFRFTPQRRQVYRILTQTRIIPRPTRCFCARSKNVPEISMATVL